MYIYMLERLEEAVYKNNGTYTIATTDSFSRLVISYDLLEP